MSFGETTGYILPAVREIDFDGPQLMNSSFHNMWKQ